MTRSTWFVLVCLLLGACGEDEGPKPAEYAEVCMTTEDCLSPLVCATGQCTTQCNGDHSVCTGIDPDSICTDDGYCHIACTTSMGCPSGLQCIMVASTQGTCRPQP